MKSITLFVLALLTGAAGVGLYLYFKPPADLGPIIMPAPPAIASAPAAAPTETLAQRFLAEERERRQLKAGDVSLALCAENPSEDGTLVALCAQGGAGHAESGWIDFYQLADTPEKDGPVAVKARLEGIQSGGYGQPGEVKPIRLGQRAPGFVVDEGYTSQGYTVGTRSLFALVDGGWKKLASLRSNLDNAGSSECGNDAAACVELDFSLNIDKADGQTLYPLIVTKSGTEAGRKVHQVFTLRYDARRGLYPLPAALTATF